MGTEHIWGYASVLALNIDDCTIPLHVSILTLAVSLH
jgi:hypothetical protein